MSTTSSGQQACEWLNAGWLIRVMAVIAVRVIAVIAASTVIRVIAARANLVLVRISVGLPSVSASELHTDWEAHMQCAIVVAHAMEP